jgi:hypothetical protein
MRPAGEDLSDEQGPGLPRPGEKKPAQPCDFQRHAPRSERGIFTDARSLGELGGGFGVLVAERGASI